MKINSALSFSSIGWMAAFMLIVSSCAVKPDFANQAVSDPETVLRLESGEDNPRNSEGDFVELEDGKILFVYSHYYGSSSSDHGTAYLASRVSSDRGKTWSTQDKIEVENEGGMNVMSVSLLRLKSGEIALFYARKNSLTDCIPLMRISKDEGATWGGPVSCIKDRKGYFVLNNDRVIQRPDGRLLVPVSQHNYPGGTFSLGGIIFCYYSDDLGKTWKSSEAVPNPDSVVLQEPGLIILKDNSILMFMRTNAGTQIFSKSTDGDMNWGQVSKSQLISPRSPATIERIPQTDDLLAVWNYNLSTDEKISKKRTPLNIAISRDEGISWERVKILEGDPMGWYCYTAMQFVDDKVLLGYCAGNQATGGLNDTSIKNVDLSWIYSGLQK